jgi:hypothetical protein
MGIAFAFKQILVWFSTSVFEVSHRQNCCLMPEKFLVGGLGHGLNAPGTDVGFRGDNRKSQSRVESVENDRLAGQNGGLAKVDSGFGYAGNFSSFACIA